MIFQNNAINKENACVRNSTRIKYILMQINEALAAFIELLALAQKLLVHYITQEQNQAIASNNHLEAEAKNYLIVVF